MDLDSVLIGTVALGFVLPQIVQTLKLMGLKGTKAIIITVFAVGALFVCLWQADAEGLIPAAAMPWIRVVVLTIAGGCAAVGRYELLKVKQD